MALSNVHEVLPYNMCNHVINEGEILKLLNLESVTKVHNINIYRKAFVHKSYCTRKNENFLEGNVNCPKDCLPLQEESNERLEFLGDSVLSLVIASYAFERYPNVNEGFLTNIRTKLVNGNMLAKLSKEVGLSKHLIISHQIELNDGRANKNILEDVFESFIGAIFLDFESQNKRGFEYAKLWIIQIIEENVDFTELMSVNINYKDKFVKYCQHNLQYIPTFFQTNVVEQNGKKLHTVCVKNNNSVTIGVGKGFSKKEAEIDAAKKGLEYFGNI